MKQELSSIDQLSSFELNSMLEHLRLGDQHLKKLLTDDQYEALQEYILSHAQADGNITPGPLEQMGNIALLINTIISSTFGSWLAMTGAMGFGSIRLKTLLATIGIAFTLSLLGAIASYRLLNTDVDGKLKKQQILNFQIKLLDKIDKARSAEIIQAAKELKEICKLNAHPIPSYECESIESIMSWVKENDPGLNSKLNFMRLNLDTESDFVKTLSQPREGKSKLKQKKRRWFQSRALRISSELLGVTIGGFASTFVYTSGFPDIVKQLGYAHLHQILITPVARTIELMLAIGLTVYFAFSYLYASQKSFARDSLLSRTEDEITTKEANMIEESLILSRIQKKRDQLKPN